MFSQLYVMVIVTISAYFDIKCRRIPNIITFPSMLLGLLLILPFPKELLTRIIWMAVFFAVGSLRLMGMGDVKLCMAVLALRGITEASCMIFLAILFNFAYALVSEPSSTVSVFKDLFDAVFYKTKMVCHSEKEYPFAVPLAIAYLCILLWRWSL